MDRYIVKHNSQEMYIHFNPHTNNYYIHDKLLGAVGFDYDNGVKFIRMTLDPRQFNLVQIKNDVKVIKTNKIDEPFIYDYTHK